MKKYLLVIAFIIAAFYDANSQALRLPGNTNIVCLTGRKVGVTQIEIHYSAPGVKGREGKIYGTNIVPFGYQVLGYGSNVASPWRAGADECTTSQDRDIFEHCFTTIAEARSFYSCNFQISTQAVYHQGL